MTTDNFLKFFSISLHHFMKSNFPSGWFYSVPLFSYWSLPTLFYWTVKSLSYWFSFYWAVKSLSYWFSLSNS
ncbi:hypothetical protein T12_3633 [Trichinella patagoniensis]|uniref:Uncharacterized protein n=1 Tax=Trichinella patagoniensis TaxID=990121 RepID=A0A0V0ZJU0_9BILA|nr:hypothetical protein T12_3633 [Trichinella patagoniensis]